jgi:peptidyl-prolyl cis-trans isomerase A (cyclophilin A)
MLKIRLLTNVCLICLISLLFSSVLPAQKITIHTSVGKIKLKLEGDKAPITTANFLQYVKDKVFDGSQFYRVVRPDNQRPDQPHIEVIQGGVDTDTARLRSPITLERTSLTGLKHEDGTISMARFTPNSARSEFFICINAQPSLDFGGTRNPDGQGFAAFGKVIKGMDIVKKIQAGKTKEYPSLGLPQRLIEPIKIIKIR